MFPIKSTGNKNKKVVVGLSGGVDSAVALALLVESGFDVIGVFMKNWSGENYGIQKNCPWEQDQEDAQKVCNIFSVPFLSWNFEKEYREKVIQYFYSEYGKGRTPNPDVVCNKEIKFKLFLEKALTTGANYVATGHYARKENTSNLNLTDSNCLYKGVDKNKDQSYFLHALNSVQLSKSLFPIGHLTKQEVRKIAKSYNLPVADKKDSQGICFVGKVNLFKFLEQRIPCKYGDIIDEDTNKKVGEHKGVFFYTIGQRSGLNIGGSDIPYYVSRKDIHTNTLFVVKGHNNIKLFKKRIKLENLHVINKHALNLILNNEGLSASIRYRQSPTPVKIHIKYKESYMSNDDSFDFNNEADIFLDFCIEQRGVASGQSVVIYFNDLCLGGGVIA
ncbi:MAG: tRNA 2-thiouridine(34) synthase MnmA [Candidatus Dojkabacteria bacterium]|nr:tRNA 2-thiouridine(34) synthase MnmA [Candidatus Dojkabacteria bacterium]